MTNALIADLRNFLTCTNDISTLTQVDATAKKLLARLDDLERQRGRIDREIKAIMTALTVAGIKPQKSSETGLNEIAYGLNQPFAAMSLPESCQMILRDHRGSWLSKSEIEYLIVRGGYKFLTKDSKNSVGVTLQRMKDDCKCEVEQVRGARGNRYRWLPERNEDAASTNDKRK